jgi:hypothetical protein
MAAIRKPNTAALISPIQKSRSTMYFSMFARNVPGSTLSHCTATTQEPTMPTHV